MIVGVDVVNVGRKSIIGFASSYTKYFTQFFSKISAQEMRKEIIKTDGKEAQEQIVTEERTVIL